MRKRLDKAELDILFSLATRDQAGTQGEINDRSDSGIPRGLPTSQTAKSSRHGRGINQELRRFGERGQFCAAEVAPDQLLDALRRALGAFQDATGTWAIVFRTLTPDVFDFNGVNFRDGNVYTKEDSAHPIITSASGTLPTQPTTC